MESTKKKLGEGALNNQDLFFKCTMIFFVQMLILSFVISSAFSGKDGLKFEKPEF